jgi:dTDP-4-dehydrorhamnose reductase
MRVLVIGHQGMLVRELLSCLASAGFAVMGRGLTELDITQTASVRRTLADAQGAGTWLRPS